MKMDVVVRKRKGVKPTMLILQLVIVLALGISAPGAQSAGAMPPAPATDSETTFMLSISQSKDPICVGDAVNVAIQWAPTISRTPSGEGLAPLLPLLGPTRIKLQASRGHFYPEELIPGSISGTGTVTYIADEEGTENIFAQAWIGGSSDAIGKDTFTIKVCEFWYDLNTEGNLYVEDEDLAYSVRYTVRSYGTLKAPDPDKPLNLEGKGKKVSLNAMFTSFSSSDCTLFTWEPGTGEGTVDARAYPNPNGIGMVLELAPPQLAWDITLSAACGGGGGTFAGVYPITSTDPWISAKFPMGSGQQSIKLDMFEIAMHQITDPHISFFYTARVKLEKEPPK